MRLIESLKKRKFILLNIFLTLYIGINLIGGERVNLEPVIEPRVTLADNTKIKKLLDWKPTQDLNQWVKKWVKDLGI